MQNTLLPSIDVDGHTFLNLMSFDSFANAPEPGGGIYAFFMLDLHRSQVTLLYIGQTHDFTSRISRSHHKYDIARHFASFGLYVGFIPMPGSTTASRCLKETALIHQLQP